MKKTDAEIINTYFIDFESLNKEEREYFVHKSKTDVDFNSDVKLAKKIIEDIDNEGIRRLVINKLQNNKINQRQKKIWYTIAASIAFLISSLGIYNYYNSINNQNSHLSEKLPSKIIPQKIFIDFIENGNSNIGYAGKNNKIKTPVLIYSTKYGYQIGAKNELIPNTSNKITINDYYIFDDTLRIYTNNSNLPPLILTKSEAGVYNLKINNKTSSIIKTFKPIQIEINPK